MRQVLKQAFGRLRARTIVRAQKQHAYGPVNAAVARGRRWNQPQPRMEQPARGAK